MCELAARMEAPVLGKTRFSFRDVLTIFWFDDGRRGQFQFHLVISLDNLRERLAANPESFRVAYVGTAGEWPFNGSRSEVARKFRPETIIAFAVDSLGLSDKGGIVTPVNFVTEVVCNGDQKLGLLKPLRFHDPSVVEGAERALNGGRTIKEVVEMLRRKEGGDEMREMPKECAECKVDQCPLHCIHLGAKRESQGFGQEASSVPSEPALISGTY